MVFNGFGQIEENEYKTLGVSDEFNCVFTTIYKNGKRQSIGFADDFYSRTHELFLQALMENPRLDMFIKSLPGANQHGMHNGMHNGMSPAVEAQDVAFLESHGVSKDRALNDVNHLNNIQQHNNHPGGMHPGGMRPGGMHANRGMQHGGMHANRGMHHGGMRANRGMRR